MSGYKELQQLNEKITELQRTIRFLCNTIENAKDLVDKNPGMAKLMMSDAQDHPGYEYK
jgi:hypothetical protein